MSRTRERLIDALIGLAIVMMPAVAVAQAVAEGGQPATEDQNPRAAEFPVTQAQELAKHLSNPVASLISVPFQENPDFGAGSKGNGVKSTLNVQPVVPLSIGANWNVIVRTILPVITQNDFQGPGTDVSGLGDTVQSFFLSPKKPGPGGIIWGAGPVLVYRTATERLLGSGKWGAGPTLVLLKQSGRSTFGFLGNHVWSIGGTTMRRDVSATFLQPFYSYTTAHATTFTLNTETTYNWKARNWTVPINLTVAQLTKLGKQPVQIGIGGRYYADTPTGGPDWGLRMIFTMLFPKK